MREDPEFYYGCSLNKRGIQAGLGFCETDRDLFEASGENPEYIIAAFVNAYSYGMYPPFWAIEYVAKAFHDYSLTRSLDKSFGLKRGRCQVPPSKNNRTKEMILAMFLYTLKEVFSVTRQQAAYMVIAREADRAGKPVDKRSQLSSAYSLVDSYSRHGWEKRFKASRYLSASLRDMVDRARSNEGEWLNSFPKHSLPGELKQRYGWL